MEEQKNENMKKTIKSKVLYLKKETQKNFWVF